MIVVVSDANIIIDLLQVDLFEAFLELDWEKHVSSFAVNEVQEDNSNQLLDGISSGRLSKPQFSPEELIEIQRLKEDYPPLSLADCSCLHLAENLSAILLTGERKLRSIATHPYHLEVHGVLWVLEQMIEHQMITYQEAHTKLTFLMQRNNRLPRNECQRLLRRWENHF